jgi:hypothetical protein
VLSAQTNTGWRADADNYLQTLFSGDPAYESPQLLETLYGTLEKEFNKQEQDIRLTQLLAVLSHENGSPQSPVYFQKVLKAFDKSPYQKALFLLDYSFADP